MDFTDQVTAFLVGMFGHRTTVDDAYIGFSIGCHADETALFELPGKGGALRKIEFATQGMEIDSALLHKICVLLGEITKTVRKGASFPIKKRKFARKNYRPR